MRVRVNGIDVFFDVSGCRIEPDGDSVLERRSILLLHGGPGMDHTVFKPAFDRLCDRMQVIYYDHRGCGRSDSGPMGSWNLEQWADDIDAFIRCLRIDRPIVLGTSFGGMVAQRFAAKYPGALSGLVLMSTAARPDIALTLAAMQKVAGSEAKESAREYFSDPGRDGVADRYFELCVPHYTVGPLDADAFARITWRSDVAMHFFRPGGQFHDIDLRQDLARVEVPTLVVHGESDPVFPPEHADEIMACLCSSKGDGRNTPTKLVRLPRCAHLAEQDAPGAIVDAILDFFGTGRNEQ